MRGERSYRIDELGDQLVLRLFVGLIRGQKQVEFVVADNNVEGREFLEVYAKDYLTPPPEADFPPEPGGQPLRP
jgi:hypothetical protein